jgi:aryl-alcohol dehydrogenase-like predicted oxidoreductase
MKRRVFLKTVGSAVGTAAIAGPRLLAAAAAEERVAGMPRRVLGRTGQKLSVVGFPGLALIHYEQDKCTSAIHSAFERGVNYFDVAPAYGNGQCETKLGIGLQGLPRDQYFLACKTKQRSKEGATRELEQSLKLLKTDHFDLYQLHHLVRPSEVKQALGSSGVLEAVQEAKKAGKIRWIGYSAHTTKAAIEVMKGFSFDSVMFPVNFVEFYTRGFGKEVLALAREQGAAVLAIKPLSWGAWPKDMVKTREWWYRTVEDPRDIELALRFSLSQPGVVAAIPPSFLDLLDRTIDAAKNLQPLDKTAEEKLKKMAETRESIFVKEEQQVALNQMPGQPLNRDNPYELA